MADGEDFGDMAAPLGSAPSAEELSAYILNDWGMAMRFIRYAGVSIGADGEVGDLSPATVLYQREGGWIAFNGRHWDMKRGESLARKLAAKVARGMFAQAQLLAAKLGPQASPRDVRELFDYAEAAGNAARLENMLKIAKIYLEVELEAFDVNPLWLNTRNGTLKFRRKTGGGAALTWQPHHDPTDRLTRMCDVDYDPQAKRVLFDKVLAQWQPAETMRKYLQVLCGYGFTGCTEEQIFIILQGLGRDGKSTLMILLRKLSGSYGATADVKSFLDQGQRGGGDASPDIARLAGATRLVSTAEPPKNAKLSDDMIKNFTGGGNMTTRRLKHDLFEFEPQGKVFLECNGRPNPQGQDEGIWRRLKLVLFRNQIPKAKADKQLKHKLDEERSGVLNWIVEGIMLWLTEGVIDPPEVAEVIEDYRKGSSAFAEWMLERIVRDRDAVTGATELYNNFKVFVEARDEKPMSQTAFGKALSDQQILTRRSTGGQKVRIGARLKTDIEIASESGSPPEDGAGGQSGGSGFDLPPDDDDDDGFGGQ